MLSLIPQSHMHAEEGTMVPMEKGEDDSDRASAARNAGIQKRHFETKQKYLTINSILQKLEEGMQKNNTQQ